MAKEVWIIDVDPPCPRCDLTRQHVERIANETGAPLNVRHMIYSDFRAQTFTKSLGKQTGTAKHVVEKAGINVDWDHHVHAVVTNPPSRPEDFDEIDGIARQWSPEMDEAIRPCQEKADPVSILMTPIIVVDKQVKHPGAVHHPGILLPRTDAVSRR